MSMDDIHVSVLRGPNKLQKMSPGPDIPVMLLTPLPWDR